MSTAIIEHGDGLPLPQRNWAILTIALGLTRSIHESTVVFDV
jgi:MFS transporter, DHA2 family, multidrug resistance protein